MTNATWAMIALLTLLWAASFLFFKILVVHIDPLVVVFYRVFFAALALVVYTVVKGVEQPRDAKTGFSLLVMGVLNNAIPFSALALALQYVDGGIGSVLNASTALFGVIVAAICFRDERLRFHRTAGVCIGFIGVAIALGTDFSAISGDIWPKLWILISSLSYALAGAWGKAKLKSLSVETVSAYQLVGSSLCMLPLAMYYGPLQIFDHGIVVIGATLGLSLVSTALAYPLYFGILRSAGASAVVLVTITIPPVAIGMTVVFLDEQIGWSEIAGFVVIGLGLLMIDGRLLRTLKKS